MPPTIDGPEAVTAVWAAKQLGRSPVTVRYWVTHYQARRLGKVGRTMYYDFADLALIKREIDHGHPVPATWQERAAMPVRCPLRDAERLHVAA